MSAQDVSSITGVPLEYIQKFEGPVLAEREYVVQSALGVLVHTAVDTDPLAQGSTFGSVIRERLYDLNAINERWASWKEAGAGWVVKLSFTAEQIDHDARWRFEPKKMSLSPLNNEATNLSQQGEVAGALIPRLRAVNPADREPDSSRFDSGAFDITGGERNEQSRSETASVFEPREPDLSETLPQSAGENGHTADLLEALRRRRGEREAASYDDDQPPTGIPSPMHPSTGSIRLVDVPLDNFAPPTGTPRATAPQPSVNATGPSPKSRKGRPTMPSWDEIVFGARPDDDLA
jgi:hypothetical protein